MSNLSGIIKSIQNIMRQDHGVDGDAQRLSQLVWMLFLKIFDETEEEKEVLNPKYKSPIPEELRWRNWAEDDEGMTGDDLLEFINNKLFPTFKNFEYTAKDNEAGFIVKSVFEDSFNYMKSGTLIRQVINKINEINFNRKADRDQFGTIYEELLRGLQSAGNAGEFYTPRALTEFIVEMVNPKLGENVFDPACGTGGFLTSVIEHVRKNDVHTAEDETLIKQTIKGSELKQLPHMLCVTNMMLHGIAAPTNIKRGDSLAQPIKDISPEQRVDCIVANPPFGGTVGDGILANFPATLKTKESADLFLILFMKLLKPNGRAGIVLPDGSLTGDGIKARIREKWLEECNLHTIIRLPNSVFSPYASVATNLLFFTKGEPTKEVWYYEHRLPEDQKSYSKTKPIQVREFDSVKKWWDNRTESDISWRVSIEKIKANGWDLDSKNPTKHSTSRNFNEIEEDYIKINAELEQLFDSIISPIEKTDPERTNYIEKNKRIFLSNTKTSSIIENYLLNKAIRGDLTIKWRNNNILQETAEEFVERCRSSKNIKKNRNISGIKKEDQPHEIPKSWTWARLSEIADFSLGKTPPSKDTSFWSTNEIPWVSISDMTEYGTITETKRAVTHKAAKEVFRQETVPVGTLLMSFKLTIGRTSVLGISAYHNEAIISIFPRHEIETLKEYLFYFLPIFSGWGKRRNAIKGDTLNSGKLANLLIPIPPIEEQIEINKIIKLAINKTRELEKLINTSKTYNNELIKTFFSNDY